MTWQESLQGYAGLWWVFLLLAWAVFALCAYDTSGLYRAALYRWLFKHRKKK